MTKNILIAIGAAGFLSLSHADLDISLTQITEQSKISDSKEKAAQERKEESFSVLNSFGIGAGLALGGRLILHKRLYTNPWGKQVNPWGENPGAWREKLGPKLGHLLKFTLPRAFLSGLFYVVFDVIESKTNPSNLHPYIKGALPYGKVFLSTFFGSGSWGIGYNWNKGIKHAEHITSSAQQAFYATALYGLFYLYKYITKKNDQEDKKSQEEHAKA